MAQAANSIQWINPSAGASFNPGQAVEATWYVLSTVQKRDGADE
jgi:hypothetical protein